MWKAGGKTMGLGHMRVKRKARQGELKRNVEILNTITCVSQHTRSDTRAAYRHPQYALSEMARSESSSLFELVVHEDQNPRRNTVESLLHLASVPELSHNFLRHTSIPKNVARREGNPSRTALRATTTVIVVVFNRRPVVLEAGSLRLERQSVRD